MFEEDLFFPQMVRVAMAGQAVTRVVRRCHSATQDNKLDLSSCQLVSFPDAVYHLMRNTVLETCDLSGNDLRKIPPQIANKFASLTALTLSDNRLSSLPDEMREMKSLERLDLSRNDFMVVPRAALRVPRLLILNLRKNFIVDVDIGRVRSAPCLRELDLQDNPLTRTAFIQLRALSKLLVLVTEPAPDDDDDGSPPNSSV